MTLPPPGVECTAHAPSFTPGTWVIWVSISPSSMRRPETLTWSSARPAKTMPS